MDPRLTWEAVEAMVAERRRQAASTRSAAGAGPAGQGPRPPEAALGVDAVTVRFSSPWDASALERLAELDSGAVPTGPALVAVVDGELVAALPVGAGSVLADPFWPTTDLVRLLELRKAQLRGRDHGGRRARGIRRLTRGAAPAETRP